MPSDSTRESGTPLAQIFITPDDRDELHYRVLSQLGSQNLISLVLYPVLWLVLMLQAEIAQVAPLFFWLNLPVLVLSTGLRYRVHVSMKNCRLSEAPTVERTFVFAVLLNASHWAGMTTWSLSDPVLQPIRVAMLLVGTGMIGSGTFAIAFSTTLRVIFPIILSVPVGITLLLSARADERTWGALCLTYLLYILAAARKRQRDYYDAVATTMLLERRTKELEQITFDDALTGLKNRRYFDVHLELEWKRAHRQKYLLTLLMIDVDHFKSINDRYGHPVGDRCLQMLGAVLIKTRRRAGDILARYGGDEFVILLVNADRLAGEVLAASLQDEIAALSLTENEERIPVTISIGVASAIPAGPDALDARTFVAAADLALYDAKHRGRNQFRLAPSARGSALTSG